MASPIDSQYFYFLLYLGSISTVFVHFLIRKLIITKPTILHPPSPPALPIIGHLHLLRPRIHRSLQTLALRYGPLIKIRVGASTMYVVSNASVAKEILKTNDLNFASRPMFGDSQHDVYDGSSFFSAEYGPYWRFLKKLMMEEILSATKVNQFISIRNEERSKFLEALVKCSEKGEACDIGAELTTFSNHIICRVAMSTRCSRSRDESTEIREFTDGMMKLAGLMGLGEILGPLKRFDLLGVGKRVKPLMLRYDTLMERILTEHEKERDDGISGVREGKDAMDILLDVYANKNAQVRLTRNNIKAFLMDIFLGGTETTSKAIQWVLAELINHPDVCNKLRDEINKVVGTNRLVDESDVPNLRYLQAIINESMRLHSTLPINIRKCEEDCKIGGYDIPSGSRILINQYAIMRDEDSWDNPTEFLPDRFQEKQVDMKGQYFDYLPFGGGRRKCPGVGLAYNVMHVTVATLVQCFDWKNYGDQKVKMDEGLGFTMGMAHPLICFPSLRVNPVEIAPSSI